MHRKYHFNGEKFEVTASSQLRVSLRFENWNTVTQLTHKIIPKLMHTHTLKPVYLMNDGFTGDIDLKEYFWDFQNAEGTFHLHVTGKPLLLVFKRKEHQDNLLNVFLYNNISRQRSLNVDCQIKISYIAAKLILVI